MTRFTRLLRPVLGLWLILCAVPVMAQTFPKFDGLVVDAAGKIDPATKAQLEQKLEALQKDTGRQLVVATIPGWTAVAAMRAGPSGVRTRS